MTDRSRASEAALRDAITAHPRLFEENRYVYPVVSRRAKCVSIGINLNPDKICNFNCIYCQVDRTTPPPFHDVDVDRLEAELGALLEDARSGALFAHPRFRDLADELKRVNDIAFSGDGEPTTCPQFPDAVERTADMKRQFGLEEVKLVLISNASRFHRPDVQAAVETMQRSNGEIWAKLDAGTTPYYDLVSRTRVSFNRILENLRDAAEKWPLVIQSLFMRIRGKPPTGEETRAYCDAMDGILKDGGRLKLIQIYTVARLPAEHFVMPLSEEEVDRIADAVRDRLHPVSVEAHYGI